MLKIKRIGLFGVLVLLLVYSLMSAEAAVITVKQDGSGDVTTIQAAHDSASSGDTILIYPGTYVLSSPDGRIDTWKGSLTYKGVNSDGTDANPTVAGPNPVVVDANNGWAGFRLMGANTVIQGLEIKNAYTNPSRGTYTGGILATDDPTGSVIQNNVIHDCTLGIKFYNGGGNAIVRDNVVYNAGNGIDVGEGNLRNGVLIKDNTVFSCSNSGINLTWPNATIVDNTLYNNTDGIRVVTWAFNASITGNECYDNVNGILDWYSYISSPLIDGNSLHDNVNGVWVENFIDELPNAGSVVTRNLIYSNDNLGIAVLSRTPKEVTSNTFYGNGTGAMFVSGIYKPIQIEDNIFAENGDTGFDLLSIVTPSCLWHTNVLTFTQEDYNCYYHTSPVALALSCNTWIYEPISLGGNSVVTDPKFYSVTSGAAGFLYLSCDTPDSVLHGASDGGFIGALPRFESRCCIEGDQALLAACIAGRELVMATPGWNTPRNDGQGKGNGVKYNMPLIAEKASAYVDSLVFCDEENAAALADEMHSCIVSYFASGGKSSHFGE